jgi:Flp pilus assembly protein TadG
MAFLTRRIRALIRGESAVAMMEAAIVLPFVLVLGMGTIEFGWLMSQIESVQTALRDSVRYATRSPLVIASNGTASLPSDANTTANSIMNAAYQRNGITSWNINLALTAIPNTGGSLYRGGSNIYRVSGTTDFTPASAGLLEFINITLPRINLRYEVRHVGG